MSMNHCFTCGSQFEHAVFGDSTMIKCARCVQASNLQRSMQDQTDAARRTAEAAERANDEARWRERQASEQRISTLRNEMQQLSYDIVINKWKEGSESTRTKLMEAIEALKTIPCPSCLSSVPVGASRCAHCRDPIPPDAERDATRATQAQSAIRDAQLRTAANSVFRDGIHRRFLGEFGKNELWSDRNVQQGTRDALATLPNFRRDALRTSLAADRPPWAATTEEVTDRLRELLAPHATLITELSAIAHPRGEGDVVETIVANAVDVTKQLLHQERQEAWVAAVEGEVARVEARTFKPQTVPPVGRRTVGMRVAGSSFMVIRYASEFLESIGYVGNHEGIAGYAVRLGKRTSDTGSNPSGNELRALSKRTDLGLGHTAMTVFKDLHRMMPGGTRPVAAWTGLTEERAQHIQFLVEELGFYAEVVPPSGKAIDGVAGTVEPDVAPTFERYAAVPVAANLDLPPLPGHGGAEARAQVLTVVRAADEAVAAALDAAWETRAASAPIWTGLAALAFVIALVWFCGGPFVTPDSKKGSDVVGNTTPAAKQCACQAA